MISLALAACGVSPAPPDGTSCPRDVSRSGGPRSYDFVFTSLEIDRDDAVEHPHVGLDVDGLCSGPTENDGCNHEDFFSAISQDQYPLTFARRLAPAISCDPPGCAMGAMGCHGCVDNQLPAGASSLAVLLGRDVTGDVSGRVRRGAVSVVLRVSDVDSLDIDDDVQVRVYSAYPVEPDCRALYRGTAEFAPTRDSLLPGGTDLVADAATVMRGRIARGRLVVGPTESVTVRLPLAVDAGWRLDLRVQRPQLRVTLRADGSGGALGVIAGVVDGSEVVASVVTGFPDVRSAVEAVMSGIIDQPLSPGGLCVDRTGTAPRFGGMSVGYGFDLAPVVLIGPPRDTRPPGACGARAIGADGHASCPTGRTECTDGDDFSECTDLMSDASNCGACGVRCCSNHCEAGVCVAAPCISGERWCIRCGEFGRCTSPRPVDIAYDKRNCGGCGIVCGAGLTCRISVCLP